MITIENKGQAIVATNYWQTEPGVRGLLYLSWNAGAGRLLVPDACKSFLREMKGAKYVIVSRGPWTQQGGRDALELLWEDGSNNPFCIHLVAEQTDRLLPATDQGEGLAIAAWTRSGLKGRWPGKYREVDEIPCLKPWKGH